MNFGRENSKVTSSARTKNPPMRASGANSATNNKKMRIDLSQEAVT
jgi:hypothetical protein